MSVNKTSSFKKCKLKLLCYLSHVSPSFQEELYDLVGSKIERLEKLNLETTKFRDLIESSTTKPDLRNEDIEYYYKKLIFQTEYALASREISYKMYKLIIGSLGEELESQKLSLPPMKSKSFFHQKVKQRRYRHKDIRKICPVPTASKEENAEDINKEPEICDIGHYCHFCFSKSESVAQVLCETGCESIMCIDCETATSCPICEFELIDVKSVYTDEEDESYTKYEHEKR